MKKTALLLSSSDSQISVDEIERWAHSWLVDCEYRQLSPRTIENRKLLISKFLWFMRDREYPTVDALRIKEFLAYISSGHKEPGGRWGNKNLDKPVRPRTVSTHFTNIRTMFRYFVEEGYIEESPVESIKPPVFRPDQIQPFTHTQIKALLEAARKSKHRRRDEAIVWFLFDAGVRASELCALKVRDLDMENRKCVVLGKGNKKRVVCFGSCYTATGKPETLQSVVL